MSKFEPNKSMPRYSVLAVFMTIVALSVVGKTFYIMTVKRDYWHKVAERVRRDSVSVKPTRGNILSCDGQLMASSLPEFKLFIDFDAIHNAKNDSLWLAKADSVASGLNAIFPQQSKQAFAAHLREGFQKRSKHWPIWNKRVDYSVFAAVKQLPIMKLPNYKGGFHYEEYNARKRLYGTLAGRTIGDMFGAKDSARYGLELSYDSILRGTQGIKHRRKVLNKYLDITDIPAVDGADIVTTLDVDMQDLAERSLVDKLKEIDANVGVAIVMEVSTGDVKAIVNMEKCFDGEYREIKNHAVSDLLEPGSVFKPASIMVALDDGMIDTTYRVDTGNGIREMYGRKMKDHNWSRGGYGMLNVTRMLEKSSNIGVSSIIDRFYHDDPERFVKGIYRLGLGADLHIPIKGSSKAWIRLPKKNGRGQWVNWSKTSLPWMSIGYETQVPPISTLAFYNAIANGGKFMIPRFVKEVRKNGETLIDFPPRVLEGHEQIAKQQTISDIRDILTKVVSQGLGKQAGKGLPFSVAGKTGTAQISQGKAGYRSGGFKYLVSFAGFFPADKPRYSCIVCIQKNGLPASGGMQCGPVFRNIAAGIMAKDIKMDVKDARDSSSVLVPDVKRGNILAANYVLSQLGIANRKGWQGLGAVGNPVWGTAIKEGNNTLFVRKEKVMPKAYIPNVLGMGAKDAVYIMERRGVKVTLEGRGKVIKQSLPPGHFIKKGDKCHIVLAIVPPGTSRNVPRNTTTQQETTTEQLYETD